MTPTEQDKDLREAILLEFKNVHRLAPADYTENCTNIVMQLIQERIAELRAQQEEVCKEPQDSQSELEFWEGMFGKSTNAKGNAGGYLTYTDFTDWLEAYVTTRIKEAIELARSKDPNLCEYGHEVYSHNTVDGWCCACDADQAFMEAEIQERVKEAYDEGYSDGRRKRPTGGNKTYGVGA